MDESLKALVEEHRKLKDQNEILIKELEALREVENAVRVYIRDGMSFLDLRDLIESLIKLDEARRG